MSLKFRTYDSENDSYSDLTIAQVQALIGGGGGENLDQTLSIGNDAGAQGISNLTDIACTGGASLNGSAMEISDSTSTLSIRWGDRQLFKFDGTLTLDWNAAQLKSPNTGLTVLDWSNQAAAVADAAGGVVIDAEARTALNSLLAKLRTYGLIAP